MKILLYTEAMKIIRNSGVAKALSHQRDALARNGIEYTLNPKDDFDIAHINTYYLNSYHLAKKFKRKGIPLIVHGHSTREDFRNSFRLWKVMAIYVYRMLKKMYSIADLIVTPTPYSKKLILSYGYNTNVVDLSNGIDIEEYKENPEAVEEFKKYFNIKDGEKVIIGVGLPFRRKGIQDFMEVARKHPNIKFIWFGHLDRILVQPYILKCIRKRPSNVIMPGYISGNIIKGAYQYASLFFFPSYEETEGIVVLEALASKTPLLVRDIGVYDGWLVNNKNCYMGKNNEEFSTLITKILETDNSSIVREGFETAKERDLKNIGAKIKVIYEDLLKSKKENK